MKRFLVMVLLVMVCLGTAFAKGPTKHKIGASGRTPREIYTHGETMVKRGFFDKAAEDFQELRTYHRDDPLSVLAQLALAEIQYKKAEFVEARYAYEEFASYHPRHENMDFVVYRIGMCIWKVAPKLAGRDQSTTETAVHTWDGFARRFPDSEYIDEVERFQQKGIDRLAATDLWIARFYARRQAPQSVRKRSLELLGNYPSSNHRTEALARLAIASQQMGLVDEAHSTADILRSETPTGAWMRRVDRALSRPPGAPPEHEIFWRPYRIPGLSTLPPQPR